MIRLFEIRPSLFMHNLRFNNLDNKNTHLCGLIFKIDCLIFIISDQYTGINLSLLLLLGNMRHPHVLFSDDVRFNIQN